MSKPLRLFLSAWLMRLASCLTGFRPRDYTHYAAIIPETSLVEAQIERVFSSGDIQPDSHRDALVRLAQELGRVKRQSLIMRLALDEAGILILPQEERDHLIKTYTSGE